MFKAVARVDKLLREDFDDVFSVTANQAAAEFQIKDLGVVVLEHHVLDVHAFEFLLMLGPLFDVPVQFAILGDWMAPKLPAAAWLLADF